jgi:PEGA domain
MKLVGGAGIASATWAGDARVGPMRAHAVAAASSDDGEKAGALSVGSVAILSDPAGADVYVDGHFVGQTPATMRLASGAHRIELRASGKRDWSRELEVIKDSEVTVRPVMERVQ